MLTLTEVKSLAKNDPRFLDMLRRRAERSFLDFVLIMFPLVYNLPFALNKHHKVICGTLEKVYYKDILRLIVNIPPGYSKTELVIILFSAWCLAKEPRARFLHTSYSDVLALDNSNKVKDVLQSEIFQMLWPVTIRTDSKAKKYWIIEGHNGSFIAVPMSGQVTGRRAGVLGIRDTFSGALLIDDPMKPDDANSVINRTKINKKYKSTVRNRIATEDVPIIVIMQRLHKTDLCGFLLEGGSGEKWCHLLIPADIKAEGKQPKDYKNIWTHGIPVEYTIKKGPLWLVKHKKDDLKALRLSDMFIWMAQYMQDPTNPGMSIFHENWWKFYKTYIPSEGCIVTLEGEKKYIASKAIYADTAMKTKEANDFSVLGCWADFTDMEGISLLDMDRGKWEAPDLQDHFVKFIKKHSWDPGVVEVGLRTAKVEDAASGTGLIQTVNRMPDVGITIEGIIRDRDKVSRSKSAAPEIKKGLVYLPIDAFFLGDFLEEHTAFNEFMTHDHDDMVDVTCDAVDDMIIRGSTGYDAFV